MNSERNAEQGKAVIRNPWILIPVFFNLILAVGIPYLVGLTGGGSLIPLLILAFIWPWILYFIIGKIIERIVAESRRRNEDSGPPDFV